MRNITVYRISFVFITACILFYKLYILFVYGAHRIDEDQALMWYGTASFLSGGILEPHFLGQMYGSMIESIIAVPMYYLGLPLQYALPLATLVLWSAPFIVCAYFAGLKNEVMACFILLLSLCFNYDYDIITNIPRSFLGGFIFSIIGVVALLEDCLSVKYKMLICPILFSIAFIITDSTIATSCIGLLYFFVHHSSDFCAHKFLVGFEVGGLIILYCNRLFYILNPEYVIYVSAPFFALTIDTIKTNLINIDGLLSSFSCVNVGSIPIALIFVCIALMIYNLRNASKRNFIVYATIFLGFLFVLSLNKSLDYEDKISYSQVRMFIFYPYSLALLMYMLSKDTIYTVRIKELSAIGICGLCTAMLVYKVCLFNNALNADRSLYRQFIRNERVSVLYDTASYIKELAAKNKSKIVVILGIEPLVGYSSTALNYGAYESYNAYFDRRSSIYKRFRDNEINGNVMFVYCRNNRVDKIDVAHVSGSLIEYISKKYYIERNKIHGYSAGIY